MAKLMETALTTAQALLAGGQISAGDVLEGAKTLAACEQLDVEIMAPLLAQQLVTRLAENPWERIRKLRALLPQRKLVVTLDARCGWGETALDLAGLKALFGALAAVKVNRVRLGDSQQDAAAIAKAVGLAKAAGLAVDVLVVCDQAKATEPDALLKWAETCGKAGDVAIVLSATDGRLTPVQAELLIGALKGKGYSVGLSLACTAGLAGMTYFAGVKAGAETVDAAIGPFAGGTSFPASEALLLGLTDDGAKALAALKAATTRFAEIRSKLEGVIPAHSSRPDTRCLTDAAATAVAAPKAAKSFEETKKYFASLAKTDEDAVLLAMFGNAAEALLKGEARPAPLQIAAARAYDIAVDGQAFHVEVQPSGLGMKVTPVAAKPAAKPAPRPAPRPAPASASGGAARPAPAAAAATAAKPAPKPAPQTAQGSAPRDPALADGGGGKPVDVPCPMQGTIISIAVGEGDSVTRGQSVAILEAMKMENDVLCTATGIVKSIQVKPGDAVQSGQVLMIVQP